MDARTIASLNIQARFLAMVKTSDRENVLRNMSESENPYSLFCLLLDLA